MNITRIEAIPLAIPFRLRSKAPAWRGREYGALEVLLVRVETGDGCVGWGEAFSYNCQAAVKTALDDMIAPMAIGKDASNISGLLFEIQHVMHLYGRSGVVNYALSGLDIALWDIAAKRAGRPLVALLGGTGATSLNLYASLFRYDDPDSVTQAAREAIDAGYGAMKVHTRGTADVGAVREAIGPGVPLMVDTNCAWLPAQARASIARLKEFDLRWLEEPLYPPENFQTLGALQSELGVSLAIGENACTAHEFHKIVQAQAARYLQPSVTKVGGISEFRKVAALAEVNGITLAPHSPYFGPGFLATLHLMASLPAVAHDFIEHFVVGLEAFPYGDALSTAGGKVSLPTGPGLGLEPDEDVIETYRVK
ncbi:MAG: mandelate racemase/muconate lactonizing enzyme family protein [Candidimonas sp.]